jgi:hypothetical protein
MNSLLVRLVLCCLVAVVSVSPALAAGKKNKKNNKGQRDATAGLTKKLQKADLPADVREKASKVVAEYGPKVKQAQAASDAVLTSEQKSALATAKKAAKESGKKRKEAAADVAAAMKLTDEQKPKYAAAQRELEAAQANMTSALKGVLTADQQAKVGLKNKKKKNA